MSPISPKDNKRSSSLSAKHPRKRTDTRLPSAEHGWPYGSLKKGFGASLTNGLYRSTTSYKNSKGISLGVENKMFLIFAIQISVFVTKKSLYFCHTNLSCFGHTNLSTFAIRISLISPFKSLLFCHKSLSFLFRTERL